MNTIILDENGIKELPPERRIAKCESILKNEKDESLRWDAVWIAGELADGRDDSDPMFKRVADLMVWVLQNDDNGVVKHEACYQIAARNLRSTIPDLIDASLNNKSVLTKHEALESLGLMRAFDAQDLIRGALDDQSPDVRETAAFVLKRLERLKKMGAYCPSQIL